MIYYSDGEFKTTRHFKVKEGFVYYPKNKDFSKHLVQSLIRPYFFFKKRMCGFRIVGKENIDKIKEGNAVIVSNHVFGSDAFFITSYFDYKNFYITSLMENFSFGPISHLIRRAGAVPIPTGIREFRDFSNQTVLTLKNGGKIIFFPEGDINPFNSRVDDFKKGAFKFAFDADSYLLPCIFTFRKSKGIRRLIRRKPLVTLNILEPIKYSQEELKDKLNIDIMKERFEKMYREFQLTHNKI